MLRRTSVVLVLIIILGFLTLYSVLFCGITNVHGNGNRHHVWQEAHEPRQERC